MEELKGVRATLIFFESAQRLAEILAAMAQVLGDRPAAVARELTKLHEEVRRGPLGELAAHYAESRSRQRAKSPCWWGRRWRPCPTRPGSMPRSNAALAFMPVKAAAELIAGLTGGSRKEIYARALELKDS